MKAEKNPVRRFRRKPTYLNAIKAMCAHCNGCTDEHVEPGFRNAIRDCTATKCPLYMYRPYQESDENGNQDTEQSCGEPDEPVSLDT